MHRDEDYDKDALERGMHHHFCLGEPIRLFLAEKRGNKTPAVIAVWHGATFHAEI